MCGTYGPTGVFGKSSFGCTPLVLYIIPLIWYMNHQYFEQIFGIYLNIFGSVKYANVKSLMFYWMPISVLCFYSLNTTFYAFKSISNLNCVFILYMLQEIADLVINCNKKHYFITQMQTKMASPVFFSRKVFKFLCVVRILCLHMSQNITNIWWSKFSTLFNTRHKLHALFKVFQPKNV